MTAMDRLDEIFTRMDCWRHLPSYQLERRADLFFSLYLPEVLERHFDVPIDRRLIPEFPARIGVIYPDKANDRTTNQSKKIDYIALSADKTRVFMVELKTDIGSRNEDQDEYLCKAVNAGFTELLRGVIDIFYVTGEKPKYYSLLKLLQSMDLVEIPDGMDEIMNKHEFRRLKKGARIKVVDRFYECCVVYIQPQEGDDNVGEKEKKVECSADEMEAYKHHIKTIDFLEFAEVVATHTDQLSQRFSQSLIKWADKKAGEKDEKCDVFYKTS